MANIHVEQVDERDSNWEQRDPRFRVYLHGSDESSTHGWTDTYDITGADVLQVIDWAQRQAGDTLTYAIALVSENAEYERLSPGRCRGLIWLVGIDGNDNYLDPENVDPQRRMLARRREQVGIPTEDHVPSGVLDPYNDGTMHR